MPQDRRTLLACVKRRVRLVRKPILSSAQVYATQTNIEHASLSQAWLPALRNAHGSN